MNVTSSSVLMVQHRHNKNGYGVSGNAINLPLKNPLHRNCLETFLSYIPIFSTYCGIRAFTGISALNTSLIIRTGYPGTKCQMQPCPSIRAQLPKIRFNAWLELFGIKGLYYLCVGLYKIIMIAKDFFSKYFGKRQEPPHQLPEPLSPIQTPLYDPNALFFGKENN